MGCVTSGQRSVRYMWCSDRDSVLSSKCCIPCGAVYGKLNDSSRERGGWNQDTVQMFISWKDHVFSKKHACIYVSLLLAAKILIHMLILLPWPVINCYLYSFHPPGLKCLATEAIARSHVMFHGTVCGKEDDSSSVGKTAGSTFSARSIREDPRIGEALGRGWLAARLSKCKVGLSFQSQVSFGKWSTPSVPDPVPLFGASCCYMNQVLMSANSKRYSANHSRCELLFGPIVMTSLSDHGGT